MGGTMAFMRVDISPETAERLRRLVERGDFVDASEAIDAAVQQLSESSPDYEAELAAMLAEGREDMRAGRFQVLTPELIQDILGRERTSRR